MGLPESRVVGQVYDKLDESRREPDPQRFVYFDAHSVVFMRDPHYDDNCSSKRGAKIEYWSDIFPKEKQ